MKKDEKPYNILMIEDNPGDALLIEEYIFEYISLPKLQIAKRWSEGKMTLQDPNFEADIILLDLSLPDRGGEELIEETIELAGNTPVVVLTGYSDMQFGVKSLALGVSDYLIKDGLNGISLYKSIVYNIERKKYIKDIEESERKYMDLFHLTPLPMWLCEKETGKFQVVNEAAIQHYGYSEEEFLTLKLKDLLSTQEPSDFEKETESEFFKVGSDKNKKIRFHQKKNGENIEVELTSKELLSNGNMIVVANDITNLTKYIQAVKNQNKKLREIAWTQSHVVRAPLSRMLGLIELFKISDLGGLSLEELLEHIVDSANELDQIIMDISLKSQEELK